jgi:hypothetical protein
MTVDRGKFAAFAESLKTACAISAVTFVIFCLVNLAVSPWVRSPDQDMELLRRSRADAALSRYGIDFFRQLYPDKSEADIKKLLYQHSVLETIYEPFVEFRMPAIATDTLNNHEAGFRLIGQDQGAWPPDKNAYNVFVFGGSTTWGGGNMDGETIPAYLQATLREQAGTRRINVYNFGAGAHFSTNEVTYFQNLLRAGFVPDFAIFIDGLNDFHFWNGESAAGSIFRASFKAWNSNGLASHVLRREFQGLSTTDWTWYVHELVQTLPVVRLWKQWELRRVADRHLVILANGLALGVGRAKAAESDQNAIYNERYKDDDGIKDPGRINAVIDRYLANKTIAQGIATEFGIQAIFVWQPVPLYAYDLRLHPFEIEEQHRRHRYGYPVMAEYVRTHDVKNLVWCADLGKDAVSTIYSDEVHYLATFNLKIAQCIADGIKSSAKLDTGLQTKFGHSAVAMLSEPSGKGGQNGGPNFTPLFDKNIRLENLSASRPMVEFVRPGPEGIRLSDDSETNYAAVYEDIPIRTDVDSVAYEASIRIKAGSSNFMMLSMSFIGGKQEDYRLAIDPQSMQIISANGVHSITKEGDGWYRIMLGGRSNGSGNDRLHVALYPAHGTAAGKGSIFYGGGELMRLRD